MNYAGTMAFPVRKNIFYKDQVRAVKPASPPGLSRGHTTADYNVSLRGTQVRIDIKVPI